jgi:hypothetical protein
MSDKAILRKPVLSARQLLFKYIHQSCSQGRNNHWSKGFGYQHNQYEGCPVGHGPWVEAWS